MRKRHRLFLIVGDVDARRPYLIVQEFEFGAGSVPQERVEIRQGLVVKEHPGTTGYGAGQGDPLPLPSRQRPGALAELLNQAHS